MPVLAQGNTANLTLGAHDSITLQNRAGQSASLTVAGTLVNGQHSGTRTYGPYTNGGAVVLVATAGDVYYEVADGAYAGVAQALVQVDTQGRPIRTVTPDGQSVGGGGQNVFTPNMPTYEGVMAARAQAVAAGGGVVSLPDAFITLTAPIPADKYIQYHGVPPRILQGVIPDNPWTFTGGTVLQGDGTFAAFSGNDTPAGSALPQGQFGNDGIVGFGAQNIGFQGFTKAISTGATNRCGVLFGYFKNLWARACSDWAFDFVNMMHTPVDSLYACINNGDAGHGIRFRSDVPIAVLIPGNFKATRLYVYQGTRTGRGVVFESGAGANLNEVNAVRVQVNRFGGAGAAQNATMTAGSADIGVTNGNEYPVGMPVVFTSTANGFTQDRTYFVVTRAANTITVGLTKNGAAIAATGSTAIQIRSNGFPNVEVVGGPGGVVQHSKVLHIDAEGFSTAQVHLENVGNCEINVAELNNTNGINSIVARFVQFSLVSSRKEAKVDFDGNSFTSEYSGSIEVLRWLRMHGLHFEKAQNRPTVNLFAASSATSPDIAPSNVNNGQIIQFNRPTAMRVNASVSGTLALDAGRGGLLPVTGAGPHVLTLPTITNASPQTSMLGLEFAISNLSAVNVTVNTDGTQTLGGQAGVFSATVPAGETWSFIATTTGTWSVRK